jgi:hypothetical protein
MVLVVLAALGACSAADHFPVQVGNRWEFAYRKSQGGWGSSLTDSGTVEWLLVQLEVLESYPPQSRITIRQQTNLARRTYHPGIEDSTGSSGYDSIFEPPRTTVDSVILRGTDGVNGLWFEGDTCWSFVLNPDADYSAGRVALVPGKVLLGGDSIAAYEVRSDTCRYGLPDTVGPYQAYWCMEPRYFSTADGIGPVAYRWQSPSCLMDAYYSGQWTLQSTNVVGAAVGRVAAPRVWGGANVELLPDGAVRLGLLRAQRVVFSSFLLDGRRDASASFERSLSAGTHRIAVRDNGPRVLRVAGRDFVHTVRMVY